jgi:hypothetical protein
VQAVLCDSEEVLGLAFFAAGVGFVEDQAVQPRAHLAD